MTSPSLVTRWWLRPVTCGDFPTDLRLPDLTMPHQLLYERDLDDGYTNIPNLLTDGQDCLCMSY